MNLAPDEFESRLRQTPLKQPPEEWRDDILAAVLSVAPDANRRTASAGDSGHLTIWKRRLRELFWPHPVAWGAIAAAWMAIGVLSAGSGPNEQRPTAGPGTFHVMWQTVLLEEGQWQDEVVNRPAANKSSRTNSQTAPSSQSVTDWRMI